MENLLRALSASDAVSRRYLPDAPFVAGLETRAAADRYLWDGRQRSGDPARPFVVLQFTLAGDGVYEDAAGAAHPVGLGRAFAAVVPGAHRYYLAPDAPASWTFFFVLMRHPYVVGRIAERQRATPGAAVLEVTEDCPLVTRAAALFTGAFVDRWEEEEALLRLCVAYDRHAATAADTGGDGEGDRLREAARRFVLGRLERPADVSELAAAHGMGRSRFSHRFRAATGESPAHHMARVRLEEVARRLVQTDATLARIASECGFADANHLCKAFRRHFHTTPGAFRRQMR